MAPRDAEAAGRRYPLSVRVLLVDNFDSFTHNLAQALGGLGAEVLVRRSDVPVEELLALQPERVVISPGPGRPERSGSCSALLGALPQDVPVLGICLGMQLLAVLAGARVVHAGLPVHGKASTIRHDGSGVLAGLPQGLSVGRYHSLCVEPSSLPAHLRATAWSEDGVLMGLRDERAPREGIQFHPESVLSPEGPAMLANFLR